MPKYKPRYSGKDRSGMCVCGHPWHEHHLGLVMNHDYKKQTNETYIPSECEHYGFNETGGLGPDGQPHCDHYQDSRLHEGGSL